MKKLQKNILVGVLCLCFSTGIAACGGGDPKKDAGIEVTKDEWLVAMDSYPQTNYTLTIYTPKTYTSAIRIDGVLRQNGVGEVERGGEVTFEWDSEGDFYGYGYQGNFSELLNGLSTVCEWSRERYDEFTFTDGVYFCKSVSLPSETEDGPHDFIKNVEIEFSDKKIASVTFYWFHEDWMQEEMKCHFDTFGTTSVTPPEGYPGVSDGLTFSLADDANGATVTGIGTEQNTEFFVIPHYYERKHVTSIGDRVFYDCKTMTKALIPNTVKTIGAGAFQGCEALSEISLPYELTSVGASAFEGCAALSELTWTPDLMLIGDRAFAGCTSLQWLDMSFDFFASTPPSVGAWAFSGCSSLSEVHLAYNLTEIKEGTFFACTSLKRMGFPPSVVAIGREAMEKCTALTEVYFNKGLTSIAARAFADCQALEKITFLGTIDEWLAVQKESGWADGTGEYTVICDDGTVTKDGTIERTEE